MSDGNRWVYTDEDEARIPGWYAAQWSWEPDEGIFVGGLWWSGEVWLTGPDECQPSVGLPVAVASAHGFASKDEAALWADENEYAPVT
jgi:hypothetical protein